MSRKYKPGSFKRELNQWFAYIRQQLEANFTAGTLLEAGKELQGGATIYHVSKKYGIPLAWIDSIPLTVRLECPDCSGVLTVDYDRTLDVNFVHLRCQIHGVVVHSPCVQPAVVHREKPKKAKVGVRGEVVHSPA